MLLPIVPRITQQRQRPKARMSSAVTMPIVELKNFLKSESIGESFHGFLPLYHRLSNPPGGYEALWL